MSSSKEEILTSLTALRNAVRRTENILWYDLDPHGPAFSVSLRATIGIVEQVAPELLERLPPPDKDDRPGIDNRPSIGDWIGKVYDSLKARLMAIEKDNIAAAEQLDTIEEVRTFLKRQNGSALIIDPDSICDWALVGVAYIKREGEWVSVAMYSREKLVEAYMEHFKDDEDPEQCAVDWVDHNICGSYAGINSPLIID